MRKFFRLFSKNELTQKSNQKSVRHGFASGDVPEETITPTKYRVASCQSTGKERAHNEDTLFILNTFLSGLESPLAFGIYLVADGMGGHQSGELASNLAAQGFSQHLMAQVYHQALFERESFTQSDFEQHLKQAVEEAQALVLRRVPGGGTTLTCAMAFGDMLFCVHVGDSRLYTVGLDNTLSLKTRDHSLVRRLVDLGEISEGEAKEHPHRNVLYRALGQSDPFEPDIDAFSLKIGEGVMICSDGLWGVISQQEIVRIIQRFDDLDVAAQELVKAANNAGGPDNISVILVKRIG